MVRGATDGLTDLRYLTLIQAAKANARELLPFANAIARSTI